MKREKAKCDWLRLLLPAAGLFLIGPGNAYGQDRTDQQACAEAGARTSGTHIFRRQGESIEIQISGGPASGNKGDERASLADCQAVALELRWGNGRNNGSNFSVTFVDSTNRPIYTRQLNGFLTGTIQFSLSPASSLESRPWLGTPWMISVPSSVTIQAVSPFAPPANLSYRVIRQARASREKTEERRKAETGKENEIVSIHNAVRLIGSSRVSLVQIELKTARPFPVKDIPLQLQIGKRVFLNELSGDYTGRNLNVSLTPEMFLELEDGAEIIAFFDKPESGDVWHFGPLNKKLLRKED
jgi:hypothetical protein